MEWLIWGISGFLECSTKKGAIKDSAAEVKRALADFSTLGFGG